MSRTSTLKSALLIHSTRCRCEVLGRIDPRILPACYHAYYLIRILSDGPYYGILMACTAADIGCKASTLPKLPQSALEHVRPARLVRDSAADLRARGIPKIPVWTPYDVDSAESSVPDASITAAAPVSPSVSPSVSLAICACTHLAGIDPVAVPSKRNKKIKKNIAKKG